MIIWPAAAAVISAFEAACVIAVAAVLSSKRTALRAHVIKQQNALVRT
jgi:hypothetical protein